MKEIMHKAVEAAAKEMCRQVMGVDTLWGTYLERAEKIIAAYEQTKWAEILRGK